MVMNADAAKFFEENPDAEYWYYSPTLRVPRPGLYQPKLKPDPFPGATSNDD